MRKADWFIGLLIAIVILLGIYFVRTYYAIQNQNPDRPSVEETLNQIDNGETATLDEEDQDDEETDTTTYEPEEPSAEDLASLNDIRAKEAESTTSSSNDATPKSYDNLDSNKNFFVVAGTFKKMYNAEIQLKKFKKLGYNNAKIGKFNKAAYASLIVDQFDSSTKAKQLVRTLKNKGLEAYVHKKR